MAKLSDLRVGDIVQVAKIAEGFTHNGLIGAIGVVVDTSGYAPATPFYGNVVGVNWIVTPPGRWVFRKNHPTFDYSFGIPADLRDYEFIILSRSEEAV